MCVLSFVFKDETASLEWENESLVCTETSISAGQDFLVFVGQVTREHSMGNSSHSITHLLSVFLLRWWFLPAEQSAPDRPLLLSSSVLLCLASVVPHLQHREDSLQVLP